MDANFTQRMTMIFLALLAFGVIMGFGGIFGVLKEGPAGNFFGQEPPMEYEPLIGDEPPMGGDAYWASPSPSPSPFCGDGWINGGEECDPVLTVACDGGAFRNRPHCNAAGTDDECTCGPCESDDECDSSTNGDRPICNQVDGGDNSCVQCIDDDDCTQSPNLDCDESTNECVSSSPISVKSGVCRIDVENIVKTEIKQYIVETAYCKIVGVGVNAASYAEEVMKFDQEVCAELYEVCPHLHSLARPLTRKFLEKRCQFTTRLIKWYQYVQRQCTP